MNANKLMNSANIANIRDSLQNMTLYDVKAYVRKAQNVMMNYSVMEAKVREATNNEPWGASSTLMQEISDGTFNYANFNEIMPMIYRRFTEKSAHEWRQIYKALQLLEFLIKHGSERVIDDARMHISAISMLKSFHYTDSNGKDQGINVRQRSKELAALLADDNKIREERKKARAAKSKYIGVSNQEASGFGGTGKKYGGFGSDSLEYGGSTSGRVFGDGGGFGGQSFGGQSSEYEDPTTGVYATASSRGDFEEYDEADAEPIHTSYNTEQVVSSSTGAKKSKEHEVDLFAFDEPAQSIPKTVTAIAASSSNVLDEDFDEFQSAPAQTTTSSTSSRPTTSSITDLFSSVPLQPNAPSFSQTAPQSLTNTSFPPQFQSQPTMQSSYMTSPVDTMNSPMASMAPSFGSSQPQYSVPPTRPNYMSASSYTSATSNSSNTNTTVQSKKKDDVFGSLWQTAASGVSRKSSTSDSNKPVLGTLAKQNATAGIWDAMNSGKPSSSSSTPASSNTPSNDNSTSSDLLF
ncbi:hypothetical protein V1511DRAFT_495465 [Dipodascopsis uninucleata]